MTKDGIAVDLEWGAVGMVDVTEASLRATFANLGVDFDSCAHVTANESLAKAMRIAGLRAISAVELTDVIVWDAMPARLRIPIADYPVTSDESGDSKADVDPVGRGLSAWRRSITGNRIGFRLHVDNVLRTYLREVAPDEGSATLLRRSVRDFRSTLEFLSAANLVADDFDDADPLMSVALDAWRHVESVVPEFRNLRNDLWDHHGKIASPTTAPSKDVKRRLDETLRHVFRSDGGKVQLLLHGFFFFTPQQWALFQLLKSHPSVDMCFVVHDDGNDRAFETWRHYFVQRWAMPSVRYLDVPQSIVRSGALTSSLEGRRVDAGPVANVTRLVRFANATEFVRDVKFHERSVGEVDRKPLLFAPAPDDVERFVERMSSDSTSSTVNLANLPVGQFLLAAHECVEFAGSNHTVCTLDAGRLVDMVASTFLDSPADDVRPSAHLPALRRALPFFSDLRRADEWVERAIALERLVIGEVAQLGARDANHSDVQRMEIAVDNELRQVPWCDLSAVEVSMVRHAVEAASAVVEEIASEGLRRADNYVAWIRKRLERAMANLDPAGRDEIERKLHGVGVGLSGVLDPEGIRDVVGMILGREVDNGPGDDSREGRKVKDVRSLDALGFRRSTVDVHVANLAETVFPAKTFPYGWPFSEMSLRPVDGRRVSREILATRVATAPLGDLYLFRLALDGVDPNSTLTFSWIGEARGEYHNPSTLLNLITVPKVRSDEVKGRTGGFSLSTAVQGQPIGGARATPPPRKFDPAKNGDELEAAVAALPLVVKGSALVCPRRFVMQWALGPSGSFQSPHQHSMLYGNVLGAISRRRRFMIPGTVARDVRANIAADLWRHLTSGLRYSSLRKRRVHETEDRRPSADWRWIFTIGGKRDGDKPTDRAYQTAIGTFEADVADLEGGANDLFLPDRRTGITAKECNMCPVAPRCSVRLHRDD